MTHSAEHHAAWRIGDVLNERLAQGWELVSLFPLFSIRNTGVSTLPSTNLIAIWRVPDAGDGRR